MAVMLFEIVQDSFLPLFVRQVRVGIIPRFQNGYMSPDEHTLFLPSGK
jgi:hypothetical protein